MNDVAAVLALIAAVAFALAANRVPTVAVALDQLGAALGSIGGGVNEGLRPERLVPYFIGRIGSAAELGPLNDYVGRQHDSDVAETNKRAELVALVLASPAFQRC